MFLQIDPTPCAMNHTIILRPTKGGICSHSAIINFFNTVHWNVWEISDLVLSIMMLRYSYFWYSCFWPFNLKYKTSNIGHQHLIYNSLEKKYLALTQNIKVCYANMAKLSKMCWQKMHNTSEIRGLTGHIKCLWTVHNCFLVKTNHTNWCLDVIAQWA